MGIRGTDHLGRRVVCRFGGVIPFFQNHISEAENAQALFPRIRFRQRPIRASDPDTAMTAPGTRPDPYRRLAISFPCGEIHDADRVPPDLAGRHKATDGGLAAAQDEEQALLGAKRYLLEPAADVFSHAGPSRMAQFTRLDTADVRSRVGAG